MGDRELLEAAARARGVPVHRWVQDADGVDVAVLDDGTYWQPLHENRATECMGDALRLAVRLGQTIYIVPKSTTSIGQTQVDPHNSNAAWSAETHGADPYAATRRAIVRAAASLAAAENKT